MRNESPLNHGSVMGNKILTFEFEKFSALHLKGPAFPWAFLEQCLEKHCLKIRKK